MAEACVWPQGPRAADREFLAGLRAAARQRGLRVSQDAVWRADGELLVWCPLELSKARPLAMAYPKTKTLAMDDSLWDVLGMPGNGGGGRRACAWSAPSSRAGYRLSPPSTESS